VGAFPTTRGEVSVAPKCRPDRKPHRQQRLSLSALSSIPRWFDAPPRSAKHVAQIRILASDLPMRWISAP
jgi:hypothetical protein